MDEFVKCIKVDEFISKRYLNQVRERIDGFILRKLIKWRKKLEAARVFEIIRLNDQVVDHLKEKLKPKYFDILLTSDGLIDRVIPEQNQIVKQSNMRAF